MTSRLKLLILGGTSESTLLARALAGDPRFDATLSMAGRTKKPVAPPIAYRIGGFGGVDGLIGYLRAHSIDVLIDATHPFAGVITQNAVQAARKSDIRLLAVRRPGWRPQPGDHWTMVPDMPAAVAALGEEPKCVFLTIGQIELAPFKAEPQHRYVIRSIDEPDASSRPANSTVITARGPFAEADERQLLAEYAIKVLVTKNSGGTATEAKLAAARALGIPVVMVERPPVPDAESVATAEAALEWLGRYHEESSTGS